MPKDTGNYDAVPPIAFAISAYNKGDMDSYKNAISRIAVNYGKDTAAYVETINKRLAGRGGADLNQTLGSIAKGSLASKAGNQHIRNFMATVQENPDALDKYTYAFNLRDPKPWTADIETEMQDHGEHQVLKGKDLPFAIVMKGDKRKIAPIDADHKKLDFDNLPDLNKYDYEANVSAIKK